MKPPTAVLPAAILAACAFLLAPAAPAGAAGDPSLGRRLFSGETRLRAGGAPCAACHRVGLLPDGGTLGPDLTKTFADYGEQELDAAISALGTPAMQPIYGRRPLSPDERAHLVAFLAQASAAGEARSSDRFLIHGLAGALALLAIAGIAGRGRLREVRRTLLSRSRVPEGGTR